MTPDADPDNPLWSPLRANAQRINGLLEECSQLANQFADTQIRNEISRAVQGLESINGRLLPQPVTARASRPTDKELLKRLRAHTALIAELLKENDRIANELGDSEARRFMFTALNTLGRLETLVEADFRGRQ